MKASEQAELAFGDLRVELTKITPDAAERIATLIDELIKLRINEMIDRVTSDATPAAM